MKKYTEGRKLHMEHLKTEIELSQTNTRIIDYSRLVSTVQLSAARLIDIKGAFDANSFAQILEGKNTEEREDIIWKVGGQFDDALINLVVATFIARRHERVIILAEASEGINGGLPWQPKLEERIQHLKQQGHLTDTELLIERYSTNDQAIQQLTDEAEALALETVPVI